MANKLLRNLQTLSQDPHALLQDWSTVQTSQQSHGDKPFTVELSLTHAESNFVINIFFYKYFKFSPAELTYLAVGLSHLIAGIEFDFCRINQFSYGTNQVSCGASQDSCRANQHSCGANISSCSAISFFKYGQMSTKVILYYKIQVPLSLSAIFTLNMFLWDITCPPAGPIPIM